MTKAAIGWNEEELTKHDGKCPAHGTFLQARIPEGGSTEMTYECNLCVEEKKEQRGCKSCGNDIKWATTPEGKSMPLDQKPVLIRTTEHTWVMGHIPHWVTCKTADQHRKQPADDEPDFPPRDTDRKTGEAPDRRPADHPPRTGAPRDKCKRCDMATDYKVSDQKTDKDNKPFCWENWSCPDRCGWWSKKKGSDYKPTWRDSK